MKILNILDLLCESKVNFILKRYFTKLQRAYADDKLFDVEQIDQEDISALLDLFTSHIDPSEKYLEWIVKQYCAQMFRLEDLYQMREDIADFEKNKNKMEFKDINRYNLRTLREEIIKFDVSGNAGDFGEAIQKALQSKDIKLIEKGSAFTIYHTLTKEGNILLGKGGGHKFNRWCTARTDDQNRFEQYNRDSNIYVAIFEDGKRFQFDINRSTHLIMNAMNELDADIVIFKITDDLPYWDQIKQTQLIQTEYKKASHDRCVFNPYINDWSEFVHICAKKDEFFIDNLQIAYDIYEEINDLLIDSLLATYELSDVKFLRTIEWVRQYIDDNIDNKTLTDEMDDVFDSPRVRSRIIEIFNKPSFRHSVVFWGDYIQNLRDLIEHRAKFSNTN